MERLFKSVEVVKPIIDTLADKIYRITQPSSDQLLTLGNFLGESALDYLLSQQGQLKVPTDDFGECNVYPHDITIKQSSYDFYYFNKNRIVSFEATESSYTDVKNIHRIIPNTKSLSIAFFFRKDFATIVFLDELAKINDRFDKTPLYSSMLEFIKRKRLWINQEQSPRGSGQGLMADGLPFLRHLQRFLKLLDNEIDLELYGSDERRERIYNKGLAQLANREDILDDT